MGIIASIVVVKMRFHCLTYCPTNHATAIGKEDVSKAVLIHPPGSFDSS